MNWIGLIAAIGTFLLIGSFRNDRHQDRILLWKTGLACVRGGRDFFPARLSPDLKYDHQRADRCFRITCIWSIKELFEQEERVKKGWFPENPKKKQK